jgi:hypothetical protein
MILTSLAVPVLAATIGAVRTRSLYVTLSEFHATVELILLASLASARSAAAEKARYHRRPARPLDRPF